LTTLSEKQVYAFCQDASPQSTCSVFDAAESPTAADAINLQGQQITFIGNFAIKVPSPWSHMTSTERHNSPRMQHEQT
jgi:hypothetical protein